MKYYFLTYQLERRDGSGVLLRNTTTQTHPLDWIKELQRDDVSRIFTLVWWIELTKEEYEKR